MNKDSFGFPFVIDLEGRVHHIFSIKWQNEIKYHSYENILKNYLNEDSWGSFHTKEYSNEGVFTGEYIYTSLHNLIKFPSFKKILIEFHPHYLL